MTRHAATPTRRRHAAPVDPTPATGRRKDLASVLLTVGCVGALAALLVTVPVLQGPDAPEDPDIRAKRSGPGRGIRCHP